MESRIVVLISVLVLLLCGCVAIQPAQATPEATLSAIQEQEEVETIWTIEPGIGTNSPEFPYEGPDYQGEECLSITVFAEKLPTELRLFVQDGDSRWAFDVIGELASRDQVPVPLSQFMLESPGNLDKSNRYPGGDMDLAGARAHDTERDSAFTITDLSFVAECEPIAE